MSDDVKTFSEAVSSKVESLICHLHGYGAIDLSREEWETLRLFASFLFEEAMVNGKCLHFGNEDGA